MDINYVYCEHHFPEYDVSTGSSDARLKKNEGNTSIHKITEENYVPKPNEKSDPLYNYIKDNGPVQARSYKCPICLENNRDSIVLFFYDTALKKYTENPKLPFVRLRMKSNDKYVRDITTERLSKDNICCASHTVNS